MNARSLALACCSGLLLAAGFPDINLHMLAWIALVPLLIALQGQSIRHAFILGGICGLVFFTGTIFWIGHSLHAYGNQSLFMTAFIMLLFCTCLAIYPALFAAAVAFSARSPLRFLAAPAIWTSLELARTHAFSGFPWAVLGYTQYTRLPLIQIADVTGVYGVSFLIVLVNCGIAEFIRSRKQIIPLVVAVFMTMLVLGYGWVRLGSPDQKPGLRISLVQGNIEQDKKWDPAYQRETFGVYQRLTREVLQDNPDLVIWPETSTPFYFGGSEPGDRAMTRELSEFVRTIRVPLLFGSPTYQPGRQPGLIALHNSAFLLSPDGTVASTYRKIHLVPFGEYVPLKSVLFFIRKMVHSTGEFGPGRDYTLMTVPGKTSNVMINTVICYEIIFPDLVRQFVKKGARVVTTITNDAWFGRTGAPEQHFSMAVFRAVENRVPVARAANTGISGFIDAKGRILASSGIFSEAILTQGLSPGSDGTFYTLHGDLFAYLCLLATAGFLVKAART